jgi:hypothetical protein
MLGAPASTAGDDFHELWAMRVALSLLDPASNVVDIKIEGVPDDELHADLGEHAQAVDVTIRRTTPDGDRFEYTQLKYSPSNPSLAWTWARLLTPKTKKKPRSSVLGKLAQLFLRLESECTISIVTNQPLSTAVASDIAKLLEGVNDSTLPLALIEKATGCGGEKLLRFLNAWDLSGFGSVSRLHLETNMLRQIGEVTDADARNDAIILQQKIAALVLPENRGFPPVTRETVLLWLGAGAEQTLFPAPSRISPPSRYLRRKQTDDFIRLLTAAGKPVRVIADGGCGKTSMVARLDEELPTGSEVIIYDCYGGGLFLASDDRRHAPEQAFVQVANEAAGRLGSPFVLRRGTSSTMTTGFRRRLDAASKLIAQRSSEALLIVCFDAVDNARVAASHWKEPCFLDELLGLSELPANVRLVLTCRTARRDRVGPAQLFEDFVLPAFDLAETEGFVALNQPSWPTGIAAGMFDLTGGTPRRLAYALEGLGPNDTEEAIKRLMPRAQGIDPLFERLVEEAGIRIGGPDKVWHVLCALANLPRPVPAWALAEVAGLVTEDIQDIANDVGGIIIRPEGWSFHDEDFEHFASSRTEEIAPTLLEKAAGLLFDRRRDEAYAARAVGEILMRTGRLTKLYDLVRLPAERPDHLGKLEARLIQAKRLTLALRCCKEASDVGTACQLLVAAAEGLKSERLVNDLLTKNLVLSSRFSPDQVMRLVLTDRRYLTKRGALRVRLAAATANTAPAVARDHMRWWNEELRDRALSDSENRRGFSAEDIAAEFQAIAGLETPSFAVNNLSRWRPLTFLRGVFERLAADAAGREGQTILDVLAARNWPPKARVPMMAAALLSGVEPFDETLRDGLRALGRASKSRWKFGHSERAAGILTNADTTLLVCELMADQGDLHPTILAILDRAYPQPKFHDRWDISRFGGNADLHARLITLRDSLIGTKHDIDQCLPDKKELPRRQRSKGRRDDFEWLEPGEKSDEQLWNEAIDEAAARLKRMAAAWRRWFDPESERSDEGQLEGAKAMGRPYHQRHHTSEAYIVPRFVRAWLIRLGVAREPMDEPLRIALDIMKQWNACSSKERIDLAVALAHVPHTHSIALTLLVDVANEAEHMAAPASDRAGLMMSCARAALPLDAELARDFYERAIAVTEKVDIEVLAQVGLCTVLAEAGVAGERTLLCGIAEQLADVTGAVNATLGMGDDFPWGNAVRAIAAVDLPTALATISQWRDIGLVHPSISVPSLLAGGGAKQLTANQCFALAVLESHETIDLEAIYGSAACVPTEAIRYEVRTALLSGSASTVLDCRWNPVMDRQSTASDTHLQLREVADLLLSWRTNRDDTTEASTEPEPEIRSEEEIQLRLDALAKDEGYGKAHLLARLAARVSKPPLRTAFLRQALTAAGTEGWFGHALPEILPQWTGYPPVARWAKEELPTYIAGAIPDLFEWNYSDAGILETLLQATGLSPQGQAETVFDGILHMSKNPSAELIYSLTGVIARRAGPSARTGLLSELMTRTSARVDQPSKVTMQGAAAPADLGESMARLLYSAMSDLDRRMRWQAAHAVHQLVRLDERQTVLELAKLLGAEDEQTFIPRGIPFYVHAAREQLLTTFLRACADNPGLLAEVTPSILGLMESTPHLTVRELGKRIILTLLDSGHLSADSYNRDTIAAVNQSPFKTRRRKGHRLGRQSDDHERKRNFSFDTTDTLPYWYSEPAGLFGMLMPNFLDRVEAWVHGKWGFVETDSHWLEEPRLDRLRNESGETSHRHGSMPVIERMSRYVEWHGLMVTVGELIQETPLVKQDRWDGGWDEWLSGLLPTIAPYWLSDIRTPPPQERRFWGYDQDRLPWGDEEEQDGDHAWTRSVPTAAFDQEVRGASGENNFVISASFELKNESRQESISVSSALVTPKTAQALAHALLTVRDPMDFIIPPARDDRTIDLPGFRLEGWLEDNHGEPQSDRSDRLRGAVSGVPFRPAKAIADREGLAFDVDQNGWLRGSDTRPSLRFEYWGERDTTSPGGGWRGLASMDFLGDLLRRRRMSMILCVEITRRIEGKRRRRNKGWQLYVLDRHGRLERVDRRRRSLGRYWVRKEGLDYSVDTAARWQFHRLEELMIDVGRLSGAKLAKRQHEIQALYASLMRQRTSQRW